jgi:hypothetical protein
VDEKASTMLALQGLERMFFLLPEMTIYILHISDIFHKFINRSILAVSARHCYNLPIPYPFTGPLKARVFKGEFI